ncbi:MAG: AsmA family protein [Clostridiaceae bacterium]|jgi:hypothetical protein|nr:AsmA family protein [Clostridiaceae bacterium]
MSKYSLLKKLGIVVGSVAVVTYGAFLLSPLFLSGVVNKYIPDIQDQIKTSTGMTAKLTGVKLVATPKLTVGVKADNVELTSPDAKKVLAADNFSVKLSLFPILVKKIELDSISADNVSTDLGIKNDGTFAIEQYFPKNTSSQGLKPLPYGIKLSNHLPNINISNYNLRLTDLAKNKEYSMSGENIDVSDFILDKKIKIDTVGKITLENNTQFNYDIKLLNKIMPDIQLNDIIFASKSIEATPKKNNINIGKTILYVLEGVHNNGITSNIMADVKTYGSLDDFNMDGKLDVENLTLNVYGKPLPKGFVKMKFNKNKVKMDSTVYTSSTDSTSIVGKFITGKHPKVDMSVKSKANLKDIVETFDSMFKAFNCKQLDTLKATGKIDADFNLKSNLKEVESSGYLRLQNGTINYGLYKVAINNIMADIDLSNNMINIKNTGLTILSQPLKIYGTVKQNADCDVHIIADKLQLRGLLLALGQISILKDNDISSGILSMNTVLKGKLNKLSPKVNLLISNVSLKNKSSKTYVNAGSALVDISTDKKAYTGKVKVTNVTAKNSNLSVRIPDSAISFGTKDILIDKAYILVNNSRINITGKIADYTTKKMKFSIKAIGNVLSSDIKSMMPKISGLSIRAAGSMPLSATITGDKDTQNVVLRLTATPGNYLSVADINTLKGKKSIINSNMEISGNSVTLSDTGLFANSLSNPVIRVTGSIDNLSGNQKLNSLKIVTPSQISMSIPGYSGSKANFAANITANGSVSSPSLRGAISLPYVSIPTMKLLLKNTSVDMSNAMTSVDCPSLKIANSSMSGKAKINNNFNNGIIIDSMSFNSGYIDADALTKALSSMPSSSSSSKPISITIYNGNGNISKIKSGGLVADNVSSNFSLKNNNLYMNNLSAEAYDGKVTGKVSYNILNSKANVALTGSGMNAVKAIAGFFGVKNALSGKLGFNTNLTLKATTQDVMMKTAKGDVSFNIDDGTFMNIGTLQSFLDAQNILQNAIMKAAVSSISYLPAVKNTANFKNLSGNMTLSNGWARINSIKSQGNTLCYYVAGKYNLTSGYTGVTVLGRLSADVVSLMGPVGSLSLTKLTSYIPKFGTMTGKLINAMTSNPATEKTSALPALASGSTNYKDFKVIVNGKIGTTSSIKSFKWLSVCDTSAITKLSIKEQYATTKKAVKDTYTAKVNEAKNRLETARTQAQTQATQVNNIKTNAKNLNNWKNLLNGGASMGTGQ